MGGWLGGWVVCDPWPWSDPEVLDKVRAHHDGAHLWLGGWVVVGWVVGWVGGL